MPSSGCFSYESNRQGPAEDRSEKGFFPFQPSPGRPVESQAAFSFRTFPSKISHLCLNVHQTFSDNRLSETARFARPAARTFSSVQRLFISRNDAYQLAASKTAATRLRCRHR